MKNIFTLQLVLDTDGLHNAIMWHDSLDAANDWITFKHEELKDKGYEDLETQKHHPLTMISPDHLEHVMIRAFESPEDKPVALMLEDSNDSFTTDPIWFTDLYAARDMLSQFADSYTHGACKEMPHKGWDDTCYWDRQPDTFVYMEHEPGALFDTHIRYFKTIWPQTMPDAPNTEKQA